jgi:hypothetical protein
VLLIGGVALGDAVEADDDEWESMLAPNPKAIRTGLLPMITTGGSIGELESSSWTTTGTPRPIVATTLEDGVIDVSVMMGRRRCRGLGRCEGLA